jgi:hypothetical protein
MMKFLELKVIDVFLYKKLKLLKLKIKKLSKINRDLKTGK